MSQPNRTFYLAAPLPLALGLACMLLTVVASGCNREADPTSPGGAYLDFRRALVDKKHDAMWARCDARTRSFFERTYETLVQMDQKIETYLPQTDRQLARKQAGTELLDRADGPEALFETIVHPEKLVVDQARRLGLDIKKIQVAESQKAAVVVTRADQKFHLVRNDEGRWHVDLIESLPAIRKKLSWIESNRSALQKTVEERIAEERERREAIISDLMNVAAKGDESR